LIVLRDYRADLAYRTREEILLIDGGLESALKFCPAVTAEWLTYLHELATLWAGQIAYL